MLRSLSPLGFARLASFCWFGVCATLNAAEPAQQATAPPAPPIPAVAKLVVVPSRVELAEPAARHGLLVTAVAADGSPWDVTAKAQYTSENAAILALLPGGELQAVGDGEARVAITFGGQTAHVVVKLSGQTQTPAISFLHDVQPLLTRAGCNQGACHGKGAGQNGFRLSLRGYAPEWDHEWITREYLARRINRLVPDSSMILTKAMGVAPHAGGRLFASGSREHLLLRDWIIGGTPGPKKDEPALEKIEVLPGGRQLVVGQTQQLLVQARFADGRTRDVTWVSKFAANDASVLDVNSKGLVRVLRAGETAVRVSFEGAVEIVTLTIPYERPIDASRLAARNNFIDEHVMAKLAALHIPPSELAADEIFLRRAFLDAIGTLPTAQEMTAFLADTRIDKRARAIDDLLARPEFVDYWTLQLGDLFQNRKERDHDVRGTKGVRQFHSWIRQQVAANRPWDQLARDVLTASGSSTTSPAVGYFVVTVGEKNKAQESEVVASVAQAMLGTRIGCAQCHNHPLEKYTQDDYYHFAGFFSRIKLNRKKSDVGTTQLVMHDVNAKDAKRQIGASQPRTGQFLAPRPLDRADMEFMATDDPRTKLADWMTSPQNEYFSGSIINRIWKHFFRSALVEPVDDLRASNPPSNPELWKALNQDFVANKFDLKHLIKLILNSRTYQLSSETVPGNQTETRYYSHYYARLLPAEPLLDAVSQVTGVPENFPGYPLGVRAIQLPDPGLNSYFLSLFGRSERVTACACERGGEVTMPQLLHLQNSDRLLQKFRSAEGRLAALIKSQKSDDEIVEELFLAALGRRPRADEKQVLAAQQGKGDPREEVMADVLWALVNSKEFSFNH